MKRWKLPLFGRITILKTLVVSKCNYLLQSIAVPKEILNRLETMLFRFLWNNENDKIMRKQMIQNYENGGEKMVDVRCQLETVQIKWVNRLMTSEEATWKIISRFCIDKYGKDFSLFKMNLGQVQNLQTIALPTFYRNMLETWVKRGGGPRDTSKSFADIRNQVIFGNQLIKHKNRSLLYKHWINDNIMYVLNHNGEIDTNIVLGKLTKNQLDK